MFTNLFKVGIGVLLAAALVFVGYKQLDRHKQNETNSYRLYIVYDNIQGLGTGNDVWLSGIKIGTITAIELRDDGRAELTLLIENKYKIRTDAVFNIQIGFLQDRILSIEIPQEARARKDFTFYTADSTVTETKSPASMQDLMNQAQTGLAQINVILSEINGVISNDRLKTNILDTTSNIALATGEAYKFAAMLSETGIANQSKVNDTISNVNDMTATLKDTSKKIDMLIANLNKVAGDTQNQENIKSIIANLKTTSENVDKATAAIKDITTDAEVHNDLKQTIKTTRNTVESADKAIGTFTKMVKSINETEFRPAFDFRYDSRMNEFSADMNVRMSPPNSNVYYLVGFDNVGEGAGTDIQFGIRGNRPNLWYEVGLKDSKLGIGFDYLKNPKNLYYGELLDPNDLKLNLRYGYGFSENLFFTIGAERLLNNEGLSIGVLQRY